MIEFQLSRTGILFVLSAPSGGGKSTILREVLKADQSLAYSISATTRPPRGDEQEGRDYFFKDRDEFEDLIRRNAFIEHAEVHGHYYGTLAEEVEKKIGERKDVVLDIDVQGSLNLKRQRPRTVLIFVLPPSIATLERRLRDRGLDSEEAMKIRLDNARHEIRYAQRYDYVIVNEHLDRTISQIQDIIEAERHRGDRIKIFDAMGQVEFLPRED